MPITFPLRRSWSIIRFRSAEELELAPGDQVVVVIKSTEVMIGKPD